MDPEIKDKTNNCEAEETTLDSSPLNNNNVLKEGVKKVMSTNSLNADDSAMDVDTEDNNSSSDKLSEKKNGILEENNKLEENIENEKSEVSQKADDNISDEKTSPNHEQNNVDEKDSSSDSPSCKESVNVQQIDQSQTEKCDEKQQNVDKNDQAESGSSEHLDNKNEADSNGLPPESETPMEVEDTPSKDSPKTESSSADTAEKVDVNDTVRPEKASVSPETPAEKEQEKDVSEKVVDADSSKPDSPDKATKDSNKEKPEVTPEATTSEAADSKNKENKSKEANDKPSSETKSESSKKDGESSGKKKKSKTCEECGVKKGLKFQVLFKGKTRFLCSDTCMKNFKTKQMQAKASAETPPAPAPEKPSIEKCVQCQKELSSDKGFFPVVGEARPLCSEDCMKKYHADNFPTKSCSQCKKVLDSPQNPDILTWETMVFCNEDCLGKYQSFLGSHCTCCHAPVPQASLGKYSVCFGADIRQFCSCSCLDEFKKNLKVCSFCQTDLSAGIDSFLAPVGDKGQFKDFCSQNCMERYEVMNNITKNAPQAQVCSHCKKQGTFKIQVKHDNQSYSLCSDMCVAGFRCSHKIKDKMCDTCFNFFSISSDKAKDFSFKFDSLFKQFCTKACMTLFVLSHRKIVACVSCKVKKYNFDMIEKTDNNNQTQIFCSLNCLSLYRVSVNATSSKSVRCDNCSKNLPAQYHLTMSDGSVRNFCNYNCVMLFQNQYTNVCTLTSTSTRQTSAPTPTTKPAGATASPVISSVISLAAPTPRNTGPTLIRNIVPPKLVPATRQPMQPVAIIGSKIYSLQPAPRAVTPVLTQNLVQPKLDSDQQPLSTLTAINDSKPASSTITSPSTITNASGQQVIREVIVKPPAPKSQKNKSVACKPIMQNKGINVKPQPCHKAVQTEDRPRPVLLPIPVPFYVPVPVHMFSRPVPCPVPFPVPMFVPLVAPSKDSSTQESMASGENSSFTSDKSSEDSKNRNDSNKEPNQRKDSQSDGKGDRDMYAMKTDDPLSSTSDECNDNDGDEDEYVFKDGKSHHHGKRHAHHKSKGRKKSKMENLNNDSHNSLTTQDRSLTMPSDQLEPAPRLKVP